MEDFNYKLDNFLLPYVRSIKEPVILELGVQKGRSTKKFLEICNKNNGWLISVDLDDCSKVSNDKRWKFFQCRDDNFEFIKSKIPKKIDVLFIDSLHEANHVEKLIRNYYSLIKSNGYIFIDDISHLPYLTNKNRNNFYCEINNKETFELLLSVYSENMNNFDLNFSFVSSGLAIIKKKSDNELIDYKKLEERSYNFKNILRKLWKKMKKD
jgi:predicted O-methyltransferase YrrM